MAIRDAQKLAGDLRKKMLEVQKIRKKVPGYVAGAAEKMKDANFAAEGFVRRGSAQPRWKKRKKETRRTVGKRILSGTGYLQSNVKASAQPKQVRMGVDLSKVPYAKVHNNGGRVIQYVRAHHRIHPKTGRRYQVQPYSRRITMPERKYLDYSPDIEKIVQKELDHELKKAFK